MTEDLNTVAAPSSDADSPGESPSLAPAADRATPEAPPLHERPARDENRIPHSRVKEMVSQAEERVRQEYAQRIADFERRIAEYEHTAPASEPKPEAAQTQAHSEPATLRERIDWRQASDDRARERESAMRERYARELHREATISVQAERFNVAWNAVRDAHQDILHMPGAGQALRAAALDAWRSGSDPVQAAQAVARAFQHQAAMLDRAKADRRERKRASLGRISAGGHGAGAPSQRTEGSIKDRIASRLAGRSGNGY